MLNHLRQTSSPKNHTIPFDIIRTQNSTIIAMPRLSPLNECNKFSVPAVIALARYLLEAVDFMHTNGVAHRDLKPENVVVDDDGSRLFVIDYGLAARVEGRDHEVYGFVGSDGFVAPEIKMCEKKEKSYYAIPADLWATGNLLEYLSDRCDDPKSPKLKILSSISRSLMDNDPEKRLGATAALDQLNTDSPPTSPDPAAAIAETFERSHAPLESSTRSIPLRRDFSALSYS